MPSYELSLLLRQMSRPELISTLKRTATSILDKGGVIRKIENLGTRELPFKISSHGGVHKMGSQFLLKFDSSPVMIDDLKEEYGRDIDILRRHVFKITEPETFECTLDDEMKPPAYRPEVQEMVAKARRDQEKKERKKFEYKSGFDYYPFQK